MNGREGDSYQSPERQRETIERLAAAKGLRLGEVVTEAAAVRTARPTQPWVSDEAVAEIDH